MRLRKNSEPRVSAGTVMMGEAAAPPARRVGREIPTTFPTLKRETFATKTSKVVTGEREVRVSDIGDLPGNLGYHVDIARSLAPERRYHPRLSALYQNPADRWPERVVLLMSDGTREEYTLGVGHSHTHEIV